MRGNKTKPIERRREEVEDLTLHSGSADIVFCDEQGNPATANGGQQSWAIGSVTLVSGSEPAETWGEFMSKDQIEELRSWCDKMLEEEEKDPIEEPQP